MFSKYPSTEQFKHVIKIVNKCAGKRNKELPVLTFIGTVKLNGMNAAVGFQKVTGHWCQSRNNIITVRRDIDGFAHAMHPLADKFFRKFILPQSPVIREHYEQGRKILIFGEWCGGKNKKSMAISDLPKMFVIFNVQVCDENADGEDKKQVKSTSFWLQPKDWSHIKWHHKSVYNIYDFPTYEIDINFENPNTVQNKLSDIAEAVGRQCPVGSYFKKTGVGEGVVWTEWEQTNGVLKFVVNGEKHAGSNVTSAPVDGEKFIDKEEFIDYVCTEHRMHQGLDYLRENQIAIKMTNSETFLKWVISDIIKEEKDIMEASGIHNKDISRMVKDTVLKWFQKQTFRGFVKS